MKKINIHIVWSLLLVLFSTSCLDIQDSYDYEPSDLDNNLYMNTWKYICQEDTLSMLQESIEILGMEEFYTQTENEYTYALMNNKAFTNTSDGVLKTLDISSIADISADNAKKETLRNILLYHIIKGSYHGLGNLSYDAISVITLWEDQMAVMTMKMYDVIDLKKYSSVTFNAAADNSKEVVAVTSNRIATNGWVHIVANQIIYKP